MSAFGSAARCARHPVAMRAIAPHRRPVRVITTGSHQTRARPSRKNPTGVVARAERIVRPARLLGMHARDLIAAVALVGALAGCDGIGPADPVGQGAGAAGTESLDCRGARLSASAIESAPL